jgi:hypothetical protein
LRKEGHRALRILARKRSLLHAMQSTEQEKLFEREGFGLT